MERTAFSNKINDYFNTSPCVAILGPRQCGKTTIAKEYIEFLSAKDNCVVNIFDLEDPRDLARLDNAMLALENLTGLIVIDEIQRKPELFPILRVLIDRKLPQQFLVLGSASRELIKQSSESLAGRIAYIELTPFTLSEVGISNQKDHWLRGGFPLSFLSADINSSTI